MVFAVGLSHHIIALDPGPHQQILEREGITGADAAALHHNRESALLLFIIAVVFRPLDQPVVEVQFLVIVASGGKAVQQGLDIGEELPLLIGQIRIRAVFIRRKVRPPLQGHRNIVIRIVRKIHRRRNRPEKLRIVGPERLRGQHKGILIDSVLQHNVVLRQIRDDGTDDQRVINVQKCLAVLLLRQLCLAIARHGNMVKIRVCLRYEFSLVPGIVIQRRGAVIQLQRNGCEGKGCFPLPCGPGLHRQQRQGHHHRAQQRGQSFSLSHRCSPFPLSKIRYHYSTSIPAVWQPEYRLFFIFPPPLSICGEIRYNTI